MTHTGESCAAAATTLPPTAAVNALDRSGGSEENFHALEPGVWARDLYRKVSAMETTDLVERIDWAQLVRDGRFNGWRQFHDRVAPDLSGCDVGGGVLEGLDFSSCSLRGTNLRNSYIVGCNLTAADLTGACLAEATVAEETCGADTVFDGADLQGCCFSEVSLRGATFHGSNLHGVSFHECDCADVQFDSEADLSLAVFYNCQPEGFGED